MKKKITPKKATAKTAKVTKKPGAPTPQTTTDQTHDQARAKLAVLFGISLDKPRQSQRIKYLHDLHQEHLSKSQVECFLYEKISSNAKSLGEIYAKQRAQIKKIEELNENKEFLAARLSYVINRYRVPIETHKQAIKEAQELLEIYKRDTSGLPHFSLEAKEKVEALELSSLEHYLKALEVNKELRNNIIGYENRLCVYRLNKLFLDYKLYVNQEILAYQERQKAHNDKLNNEFDEVLSHFSLPHKKMTNFSDFLSTKILSTVETLEKLKEPLKVLYDRDVEQIDRMIREMEIHQSNDLNSMVQAINHYQKIVLDKEAVSNNNAHYLVALVEKLFSERINQSYELVAKYDEANKKPRTLDQKEIDLLLQLNRQELKSRIEKLKHQFTNMIKPLTDDFDKMSYVIDHDHALDKVALQQKLVELKSLENENINFFTEQFEKEKAEVERIFNEAYDFIIDDCQYTKDQFDQLFTKCKKEMRNICVNIIARNKRFWLKTKNEFTLEAKKFLTKLHYENAPWSHKWRSTPRAWMHDYLLINLSAEYLFRVGESLKKISPQGLLFTNIAKALIQFNEKSREVYKRRDEIEYEQLIRLNSLPEFDLTNQKHLCNQNLSKVNSEFAYLEKKIKSLQSKI